MYTDEEVKVIKRDRDQAKQLNIYLLARLFQIYKLATTRDIKRIISMAVKKTGLVYPELFSIISEKVK
ncbi:MAG: hypothetical protein LKJ66_14210 [Clostridium luticellarii]|jgi:hypothetical protein|uniref:Uncharacterized protein n=1 Tax=Clostridium luticellarii TaxID=1691940 RepID=A0A2T0BSP0_9CLOT|nr:hypothetical protein [Clostridium luticellarii]MCI1946440.1 hypothetical protein [Clostridium luticellarii]MCI1996882.1 hypothetical protein [Clostridium luticellarii]MCI2041207.1 hypothetical protein [Clostridium luticellarii]PRR86901.1 hypothetical protein CLLU_00670 [Clostridium luticellarii]